MRGRLRAWLSYLKNTAPTEGAFGIIVEDRRMLFGKNDNSIIREIQGELLAESVSVAGILRKARLAARKLDLQDFEKWIANESDGYKNTATEDLPDYRKIGCVPRFFNPYRGWCPIIVEDRQMYELCHTSYLFQSIAEIENLLGSDGTLTYTYPPELTRILRDGMDMQFEIRAFVSQSSLAQPINAVKNIVLDWAVDLEKAGVVGAGLGFSSEDKREAETVTQNIYAQNIGNLGNVSDRSSITNTLSNNTLTFDKIDMYSRKIRDCIPALPELIRSSVETQLDIISQSKSEPDQSKIKSAFQSIRTICENIIGNLAADGIVALIKTLF